MYLNDQESELRYRGYQAGDHYLHDLLRQYSPGRAPGAAVGRVRAGGRAAEEGDRQASAADHAGGLRAARGWRRAEVAPATPRARRRGWLERERIPRRTRPREFSAKARGSSYLVSRGNARHRYRESRLYANVLI